MFTGDTKECLLDVGVSQSIVKKKLKLKKLRELSKQFGGPLSILFRRTLDEETVSADWRAANVTSLYKKVLLVVIDR